ncbi:MAG TPA: family 10 glycosylhydrolase [Phycisphaerae bacterium]|nr:family 10 glycosylhydrolase [Phycisphaerae bacterium]HOJ74590.1 family 10 glycosylhydrolase [Phycisphaerae bacterium]HOM50489.1 family 10 glycosylhydrolase [Phycisphaerae bacterium]HOQ87043.1 family 10 glycosylhydrolase [Phycisphaerae bacterium]HPP28262.1 family 10 glycosylhydrolase [Phycisphaerae bacterium]
MKPTHIRAARVAVFAIGALAGLVLTAGCQTGPRIEGPVRAIWVTRFDYKTADDVCRIMQNCQEAGFNTVVFQVRGNGTAFYRSQLEPWAEQFDFKDPGFDPLEVAVVQAHERGLELHAWMNVMPAWRGTKPPSDPRQLYNAKPEWFWYDQHGNRQALSTFYVSLNPCLPEVRQYLVDVFREVVGGYDVDGLHLDYIRFPSEPPATPPGSGLDYPRDARTLALYKEQTGLTPDENIEAWNQWRTDAVTQLVADIRDMMRRTKPRAVLAVAGGSNRKESLRFFRDDQTWVERGLIDAIYPMNYQSNLEKFKEGLTMWVPAPTGVAVVPGMWFASRLGPEEGPEVARQQVEYALHTTGNVCVFSYSSLFDSTDRELTPVAQNNEQAARQRQLREKRRQAIIPLLKGAAGQV